MVSVNSMGSPQCWQVALHRTVNSSRPFTFLQYGHRKADPGLFGKVTVEADGLAWPNGADLCLHAILWGGKIGTFGSIGSCACQTGPSSPIWRSLELSDRTINVEEPAQLRPISGG
jgi:hypothetical protein